LTKAAPALGRTEPAVVTFTTAVVAAAVGELLERLIEYGPEPRPSEVLMRCHDRENHDREISTNIALSRARHRCHPQSGKLGMGMTQPFLSRHGRQELYTLVAVDTRPISSFLVNDHAISGAVDLPTFKKLIDAVLKESAAPANPATPK
jgi:hypothetical protein